ncbi:P-loop containing nucleoside triphosphate hydrolase protein [Hypoxylon sp. FL1284]|nr:P-loop containing nucleoside triphosphate hydrolase protein [Hypoxylon sp. FL1284]
MPSLEPRRRSRARFEEENDEQSSESDSPKRQKRTADGMLSEHDDSDDDRQIKTSPSRAGRGNGAGGFQPGAIVRVLVQDFVTYEHAEFHPGPNLNMVIGPNGTGKSSLVCAICLGLGYPPKHLGRAAQVGEFVKHGKENAIIEIELQGRPDDADNHVIRMQIRREDNKSKWWINGKESSSQLVKRLVNDLRIQIDNLCQFLPQDRVAEFAGLTPVQLLHETLRAAAPQQMITWHDQLKDLHEGQKKYKAKLDSYAEILKNHETRQQGSQADVDRLRDREAIQNNIQKLKSARIVAEYRLVRVGFHDAKLRSREATNKLKELEEACGPALQAVNRKQEYQYKIDAVVAERKKALERAETASSGLVEAIESQNEMIKDVENKIEAENKSLDNKRNDILRSRRLIADYEARLQQKPPEFVAADYNTKIRQQEAILRENEAERRELRNKFQDLKDVHSTKNQEKERLEKELNMLDSQEGQKLSQLRNSHADAAKGWEWLQEHQHEFEKEVFGPAMLNCSVTDQKYSDQIQALLAPEDFFCFTCQTRSDHKKLSAHFYDQLGLTVSIRTCGSDFTSFQPSIPKERIRQMGLDAYAIEYLDGPKPVLAMLCAEKRLHISGVAREDINNDQYEQIAGCRGIISWASGRTLYRIQRRAEYGGDATSTSTRTIAPGRFWTNQPVDQSEKAALRARIEEANADVVQIKMDGKKLNERSRELDENDIPINEEIDRLKREKADLQRAAGAYASLEGKIATERTALESAQKGLADYRARLQEFHGQMDELIIKKARSIFEHKEQLSRIRDAHEALLEVQIRLIEATSDVKGLEQQNASISRQLNEKRSEIDSLKEEVDRLRSAGNEAKAKVQVLAQDGEDISSLTSLAGDRTPEDINDEIGAESTKLGLIHAVDPAILRQYQKRAQEIQELTQKKEQINTELESRSAKMAKIKEQWEPRVDEVIGKINDAFSHNFEQINCAGEVSIHKEDDFDRWCIVIKVKFRENENLQQLNQHRQSGGERAVSTIFYLMALQSMAQAPFRVVDEINQGMDPRNERMVHERMVEIACREHTSQYFLITPKLLTGLRYDERMRVLCIASGEHMPPAGNAEALDFSNLVRIQRAVASAA